MSTSLIAELKRYVPKPWRRSERLRRRIEELRAGRVLSGPFAGMIYVDTSFSSELRPKLLGTYELEIRERLEAAIERAPRRVVVLGAAEGYYAVGLARRLPSASVVAFEANERARAVLADLARRNGASDRIEIRGLCDVPTLRAALGDGERTLVFSDVEGAEAILLDPRIVPELARVEMLVETHDCFLPGTRAALVERFCASHEIAVVEQRPRTVADAPPLGTPRAFDGALYFWLVEGRPLDNHWLHLCPR
jgi:hypothetical protein